MTEKSFQATGNAGSVIRPTAREAAIAYFETYPKSRKCNVIEGIHAPPFFTVSYGFGNPPRTFKDVTKKQAPLIQA